MRIGLSMPITLATEEALRRPRLLNRYLAEVSVPSSGYLEALGLDDIVDPLAEVGVRVESVKVPADVPARANLRDPLEKCSIVAEELGARNLVVEIGKGSLERRILEEMFRVASVYNLRLCLELEGSTREISDALDALSEFVGGVLKLSLKPLEGTSTPEFVEAIERAFGLLRIIRLANYDTESGRTISVLSGGGTIDCYAVLRYLVERGFDGLLLLDYESRGEESLAEIDVLVQYTRSLMEKV